MLIGTTFAWFTDSVTSTGNKIQSGTLKVDLELLKEQADNTYAWESIKDYPQPIFNYDRWEPGYTDVKILKVENEGTLALKWVAQFVSEKQLSALADVIDVYVKPSATALAMPTERDVLDTYTKVGTVAEFVNTIETTTKGELLEGESAYLGIALKMQETAGNEYQGLDLGGEFDIRIFATQLTAESDSFDNQYDKEAPNVTYEVTPANIQAYLDGEYADLENATLLLTAGDYGTLYLGRSTKHEGSNTVYICNTHDYETDSAEEFATHRADGAYHTTPRYETTVKNLTLKAEDGVTVDGVLVTSGHTVGPDTDYVLDRTVAEGDLYYNTLRINGLTFDGLNFTGKVNINTSQENSVYDGVSFVNCSFTTGGTNSANGAAVRYYNEANNGNVKNLTVDNCTFQSCYQGIYTANTNGITVVNSEFDTTGHNAIAIQSTVHGAVDLKDVVIENNVFKNVADRIIRFGEIGADSDISIQYNYARNSGDEDKEVIKAVSIDSGAEFDVKFNDWGADAVIANSEFSDTDTVALAGTATEFKAAAERGEDVYIVEDIEVSKITVPENASVDIALNGNQLTVAGLEANSSDITISGGTLVHATSDYPAVSVNNGGSLTLENVAVVSENYCNIMTSENIQAAEFVGIQIFDGTCVLNDCTIEVNIEDLRYANSAVGVGIHGGSLVMNGGAIIVKSVGSTKESYDSQTAIFAGSDTAKSVTLNNVTIDAKEFLCASRGSITVNTTDANGTWDGKCSKTNGTYTINYNYAG